MKALKICILVGFVGSTIISFFQNEISGVLGWLNASIWLGVDLLKGDKS